MDSPYCECRKGSRLLRESLESYGYLRLRECKGCKLKFYTVERIFRELTLREKVLCNSSGHKISSRNKEICEQYKAGKTLRELAAEYKISFQRIHQIIQAYY